MPSNGGVVLVADPSSESRAEIVDAFGRAGFETVGVASALETLGAVRRDDVCVVLLELELPDLTGYEACRQLREEHGDGLPIIFLSGTRTEPLDRVAGLLLGADDFVVKPFDRAELIARVRRFTSRGRPMPPVPVKGSGRDGTRITQRERQVLVRLAHGTSQRDIAEQLEISPKTVATHIQNLLRKLGAHSRAELVARAWQLNMTEPAPGSDPRAADVRQAQPK